MKCEFHKQWKKWTKYVNASPLSGYISHSFSIYLDILETNFMCIQGTLQSGFQQLLKISNWFIDVNSLTHKFCCGVGLLNDA